MTAAADDGLPRKETRRRRLRLGRMRDWLPKGLYWRTILIILGPAAILQLAITIIFLDDHWRFTSKRLSEGVAGDIGLLIALYERDPTPETLADVENLAQSRLRLRLTLEPDGVLEKPRCSQALSIIDRYFDSALAAAVRRPVWFDATCPGRTVEIRVPLAAGVLRIDAPRTRVQAQSGPLFVIWVVGGALFFSVVSIVFIRNQVRPIERLAEAMEEFGRGTDRGLFKARGAREVRRATHAFFDMRARIKKHIDQRGQLLAGVSHDLRTPLTRLKLQLAMMPDGPDIIAAKRDLEDMERTLDEYLDFARGQWSEETSDVDLAALLRDVAAHAGARKPEIAIDDAVVVAGRAPALRRALQNLMDNALSHGDRVRLTLRRQGGVALLVVEDDGPGIPEDQYEEAFRPFSRLDESRMRNPKGVGLGLAIARDVARAHGGEVLLARSALGGLSATLRLPAPIS